MRQETGDWRLTYLIVTTLGLGITFPPTAEVGAAVPVDLGRLREVLQGEIAPV